MTTIRFWLLAVVAFYLRRTRIDAGRWRLVDWALRAARELLPGRGRRTVRTRHRFRMNLDLDDWLGQFVYVTGEYEERTSKLFEELLRPGAVVLDVGAHVGYFTLLAARCVGRSGQVHSFEPVPWNRERLEDNCRINRFENVTIHCEAVSDQTGTVAFHEGPANHRGTSSLRPLDRTATVHEIPTAPLVDLIPTDQKVAFIKIDVEGAELKVLRGMSSLLDDQKPDIVLEVSSHFLREMGDSSAELCELLISRGYKMYRIDYAGLVRLDGWSDDLPEQFNALFTCRDELPRELL